MAKARSGRDATSNEPPTELWLDALFGSQKGYVYAPVGVGGFINDKGKYAHRGWEGGHFFRWPAERADVIAHIRDRSRRDDVYIAPRLRTGRNANVGSALDGSWLFADMDNALTRAQQCLLRKLVARGHMLVQSGSLGHQHLYLELDRVCPVEQLTALNRRLALALAADSKWQDNVVLRPPDTPNHKGAASGAASSRVKLASHRQGWTWSETDLDALLPPLGVQSATLACAVSDVDWDGTLPDNFDDLMSQGADRGSRSERTFHFVMKLIEGGVPLEEIVMLAEGHHPTADRGRVDRDVELIWNKHPHPGSNCHEVGCVNATKTGSGLSVVESVVRGVLSDLRAQPWSGRDAARRKVVAAACRVALAVGDLEFYISDRDLALIAGMNRKTVVKRLGELSGWVECLRVGDRRKASVYRLCARNLGPQSPHPPVVVDCGPTWGPMADAFRYGGLGVTAGRIYNEGLHDGPKTTLQLQERLHLARPTINKGIARLAEHGLIETVANASVQRVIKSDEEWDNIAAAVGKLGRGERQEKAHIADKKGRARNDCRHAAKELHEARELLTAAIRRGSRHGQYFWQIEVNYWAAQARAAVEVVVQPGATTVGGRIARGAQVPYETKLRAQKLPAGKDNLP